MALENKAWGIFGSAFRRATFWMTYIYVFEYHETTAIYIQYEYILITYATCYMRLD